jgi:hypothetical protein
MTACWIRKGKSVLHVSTPMCEKGAQPSKIVSSGCATEIGRSGEYFYTTKTSGREDLLRLIAAKFPLEVRIADSGFTETTGFEH